MASFNSYQCDLCSEESDLLMLTDEHGIPVAQVCKKCYAAAEVAGVVEKMWSEIAIVGLAVEPATASDRGSEEV